MELLLIAIWCFCLGNVLYSVDGQIAHPKWKVFSNFVQEEMLRHSLYFSANSTIYSVPIPILIDPICANDAKQPNITVLFLGDSVNRFMIEHWCNHHHVSWNRWGKGFVYSAFASPATYCFIGNIRVATINMYGSAPKGPYFKNITNTEIDPNADTELRIKEGIRQFVLFGGEPQFVFFKTDLWDMGVETRDQSGDGMVKSMELMIQHYKLAFHQIRGLLPDAYIGLHTSPRILKKDHYFFIMQNVLRYLSHTMKDIFLFDWNLLLEGVDPNDIIRGGRDLIHPKARHNVQFLNLMVSIIEKYLNVENCKV